MTMEPLENMERVKRKGGRSLMFMLVSVIILAAIIGVLITLHERESPQISLLSDTPYIGVAGEILFSVTDMRSGVRSVEVFLEQGDNKVRLLDKDFARQGYFSRSGPNRVEESIKLDTPALGLQEGRAGLVVKARDFSFWKLMKGNETTMSYFVTIDTHPPRLSLLDSPRYIKPGGTGIVTYTVNEPAGNHGVVVNGRLYPGFSLAGHDEGTFGALIALDYNTEELSDIYLSAVDRAMNTGKTAFGMILRRIRLNNDRIDISDGFLERKLPEFLQYYPDMPGDTAIDRYLYINNEIRKQNNARIKEICSLQTQEQLWKGPFKRMARSSTRAGFADFRTYYYQGRSVDEQVHLGIDLASVRNADVKAANRGRVAFVGHIGIYGNTVILDHGQGLFSLYSHLSRTKVSEGDVVLRDGLLGKTGTSGMAGGDHLHFAMLVNGVFVNPLEWWDRHWLTINILNYL